MKKLYGILLTSCVLMALGGCRKAEFDRLGGVKDRSIRPVVSSVVDTKAEQPVLTDGRLVGTYILSDDPEAPLYLSVFEKDITGFPSGTPATKGTELTSVNLDSFNMMAWAEDKWHDDTDHNPGKYFEETVENVEGEWTMGTERYWLNGVPISFWCWSGAAPTFTSSSAGIIANYTVDSDVTAMEDLVYAYNSETRDFSATGESVDNTLDIHFHHALAAVKFDVSSLTDAVLTNVKINNIYSTGTCRLTVSDGAPQFSWLNQKNKIDLSQAFSAEDFESDGSMKQSSDKVFFMIPQVLTDEAELEIIVSGSGDKVAGGSRPIAKFDEADTENVEWKAGKFYTYRITSTPFENEWDFVFELADPLQERITALNANRDETKSVNVISRIVRKDDHSIGADYPFRIVGYFVGSPLDIVDVEEGRFSESSVGVKEASLDGNDLKLSVSRRILEIRGTHDFWVDATDKALRPEWHPDDWTEETRSNPIDLSGMDFRRDDISDARKTPFYYETANCYVIRHAGYYKLPLVYGNGVRQGTEYTEAYKPLPGVDDPEDHKLGTFLNHLNAPITSAFIENNAGCDAAGCKVVWQSNGEVVKFLNITGTPRSTDDYDVNTVRYLEFYVDPDKICQSNSLIAITDSEGEIIWSWQLWITNDPAMCGNSIWTQLDPGSPEYYFMPVPTIGRVVTGIYTSRDDVTVILEQDAPSENDWLFVTLSQPPVSYNVDYVVYQFGRKDPILCKSDNSSVYETAVGPVLIGGSIQNPDTFYSFISQRWTPWWADKIPEVTGEHGSYIRESETYVNLWSGKSTATGLVHQNADMTKTIYDPSPIGYKVPAAGAFSFTTTTGTSSWDPEEWNTPYKDLTKDAGGMYFYTTLDQSEGLIFFPADGIVIGGSGVKRKSEGWFFSANLTNNPYNTLGAYGEAVDSRSLGFYWVSESINVGPTTASPSNGHGICPVIDTTWPGGRSPMWSTYDL